MNTNPQQLYPQQQDTIRQMQSYNQRQNSLETSSAPQATSYQSQKQYMGNSHSGQGQSGQNNDQGGFRNNSLRSNGSYGSRGRMASFESQGDQQQQGQSSYDQRSRRFGGDDNRGTQRPRSNFQQGDRNNGFNRGSQEGGDLRQKRNFTSSYRGSSAQKNYDGEGRQNSSGYQGRNPRSQQGGGGGGGGRDYSGNNNGGTGGYGNGNGNGRDQQQRNQIQPYMSRVHSKGLLPYTVEEGFDNFVTVLMVAEKPSIARSIAEALGGSGFTTRKGICKFTNVFTFYGSIFGKRALIKVTSVIGHIYTTDFTEEFQDWRRVDPYKLFNATTMKKETNQTSQILPHLQKEAMGASYLILWLDNDREGENICFEVLTTCKPELIKEDFQQVFRAKFSSITPVDLRQAYDELSVGPNLNESIAVDARQVIDLKLGVAFSRFQTRYLVRKYQDLNNKKITFGPCQTPTLAFCVSRDDEINRFQSQKFYKIIPKISLVQNEIITLDWIQERTYEEELALQVKEELEAIGQTIVTKVDNKETQKIKPVALNTVNFLKIASRQYGLGPQNAMQVAEKLYLGGYITYPRTESTKYSDRFDFDAVVSAMCGYIYQDNISSFAKKLTVKGIQKSRLGKDVGDHPPITPTSKVLRQQLSRDEQNVYELISRYFLASVSYDCRLYKKKIIFQTGTQTFSLVGTAVIDKGFMEVIPWQKIQENEIPNFALGDTIYLHSVDLHSGKTQPPEHLSESDLIGLMEQNGIGTDASMAQHISNISEREYVQVVGAARRLIPTELGSSLIHAYAEIDPELVAPNLRSSIEKSVDLIAQGELDKDHVLSSVIELFKNKYLYFVSKVAVLDKYFDPIYQSIESTISESCFFTKCGRCKNSMRLLEKIGKLFCEKCKFMYGLPRDSKFSVAGDIFCPLDGFQLILVEQVADGNTKRYTLCPLCFQKPPEIEDYKPNERYARTSCNLCTNRGCQFSMINNEIGACQHCKHDKGGRLVLDWPSQDTYTMTCNGCNFQYVILKNGQLIRSQIKCTNCNCYQVKIEKNDGFKFIGCMFCDSKYRDRLEECKPICTAPKEEKTDRYFDQQEQIDRSEPIKPRTEPSYMQSDIGILDDNSPDQSSKRKRGRPPKPAFENLTEQKLSRKNSKISVTMEDSSTSVGLVKKGIAKVPPAAPIKRRTTPKSHSDILEDSLQQDFEFFKKFPKQPQSNNNNNGGGVLNVSETFESLRESSSMLADIEADVNFNNSGSSYNSSSLMGSGKKSYPGSNNSNTTGFYRKNLQPNTQPNQGVQSVTRPKNYLPQPSNNNNLQF